METRTPFKVLAQSQEDGAPKVTKGTTGFCPVPRPLKPCLGAAQPPLAAISIQTSGVGGRG